MGVTRLRFGRSSDGSNCCMPKYAFRLDLGGQAKGACSGVTRADMAKELASTECTTGMDWIQQPEIMQVLNARQCKAN
jgi:hypothetical protein